MRMAKAGHSVSILTTSASPTGQALPAQEEYRGISIIRCQRWNNQLNLGFYPSMMSNLLSMDVDVVHQQNGPGFIWQEICVLAKKLKAKRTKFVVTPHGPFLATLESYSGIKKLVGQAAKLVLYPYFKFCWGKLWDLVIQVNPKQQYWMQKDYGVRPSKIELVPNGISEDTIIRTKPMSPQELAAVPVVMTYVGRISWYKGVHKVLYALKEIEHISSKIQFIVMGKTFDTGIQQLAESLKLTNVQFIESPTDTDRNNILINKSQINILPSKWEATGISLLDAMAMGNAIITTTQNEAANILIEPGVNGYVYDFDDTLDLAEIVTKLISDHELRQEMIRTNLVKIHQFTWEAIFPHYQNLLWRIQPNLTK